MKATQRLRNIGQSLWLDNITRDLLTGGTLQRYIDELSVTGLTSNPSIFDHAVTHSKSYDTAIKQLVDAGKLLSRPCSRQKFETCDDGCSENAAAQREFDGFGLAPVVEIVDQDIRVGDDHRQ